MPVPPGGGRADPDSQKLYTHGGTSLYEKILLRIIPYQAALLNYSRSEVLAAFGAAGYDVSKVAADWDAMHPSKGAPPFNPPGNKTPGGTGSGSGGGGGASAIQPYIDAARQFGKVITAATANKLIAGRVSLSEWTDRLRADETIENNKDLFNHYNDTLKAHGMQPLSEDGLLTFMVGKAPRELYDIFNEAAARFADQQAKIGPATDKSYAAGAGVIPTGISVPELNKGYADMVEQLKKLPFSRLHALHLTRSELLQLEFGGPLQAKAKEKVQRIAAEQKLAQQGPVEGQAIPTNEGVKTLGLEGISGPTR